MSWGYKILIVYVGFITMIMGMVYIASKQTNEMQAVNYYAEELEYQTVIDGKNNLNKLSGKLSITNAENEIRLSIPDSAHKNITEGEVYFLKPSDESKDIKVPLVVDSSGIQVFPKSNFVKGLYTVKVSWKNDGIVYFAEQPFNVY